MENSKYYTPTIDEFHVGFECEYLNYKKEWVPTIITEESYMYQRDGEYDNDNPLEINRSEKYKTSFRVKFLDHEDILAEGWERTRTTRFKILSNDTTYLMSEVVRGDWLINNEFDTVFFGTIRNRSELRRVMKMIGI